mmetsp:Transcript_23013/g.72317  ORF Transcript_23013/g.72317 Transcript_23013/m.72317 type:complete len:280 (-) Transcript_23013:3855-4694(-)
MRDANSARRAARRSRGRADRWRRLVLWLLGHNRQRGPPHRGGCAARHPSALDQVHAQGVHLVDCALLLAGGAGGGAIRRGGSGRSGKAGHVLDGVGGGVGRWSRVGGGQGRADRPPRRRGGRGGAGGAVALPAQAIRGERGLAGRGGLPARDRARGVERERDGGGGGWRPLDRPLRAPPAGRPRRQGAARVGVHAGDSAGAGRVQPRPLLARRSVGPRAHVPRGGAHAQGVVRRPRPARAARRAAAREPDPLGGAQGARGIGARAAHVRLERGGGRAAR